MSSQLVYYEEQFKENVMKSLLGEQVISLKQVLENLIHENQQDYKVINYAYLNVKRELVGCYYSVI